MSSEEIIKIEEYEVHLVKSKRARSVFLKQNLKGQIVLVCPALCHKLVAIAFAQTQKAWIKAHIENGPKEHRFQPNDEVMILGKVYTLKRGKRTEVLKNEWRISGEESFFHRRVCSLAQKQLLSHIQEKVKELTQVLQVKVKRITLRNTSSRWGSCSSEKNLSFCWKIAFAPMEVIDYLVAHEVAHLVQMNHSQKFWKLVDTLTNHREYAEKWLKENGRFLQSIQ